MLIRQAVGVDYVAYWLCCAAERSHTSLTKAYTGKCGSLIKNTLLIFLLTCCILTCVCDGVCVMVCVCVEASQCLMDVWRRWSKGRGELPPGLTVLRVLHLSDAAVGRGSLVVVLGQRQGADPGPRGGLGAGRLRLLQAAVVVAVLGRVLQVLQVLRLIGRGESHSAVGRLWLEEREKGGGISDLSQSQL